MIGNIVNVSQEFKMVVVILSISNDQSLSFEIVINLLEQFIT